MMRIDHSDGRSAFLGALDALVDVATGLDDDRLMAASRCRGWSVADVLVHVHLGLQEMLLGIVSPTGAEADTDAASYWQSSVPTTTPTSTRRARSGSCACSARRTVGRRDWSATCSRPPRRFGARYPR